MTTPCGSISIVIGVLLAAQAGAAHAQLVGPEFQVNVATDRDHGYPAIAVDGQGRFVVAWHQAAQNGYYEGITARRYDAGANPLGEEFSVNAATTWADVYPSVAANADGEFVVVWTRWDLQYGPSSGFFARWFSSSGDASGDEFELGSLFPESPLRATATADGNGDFIIVWSQTPEKGSTRIHARRFDASGAPLSDTLQVNEDTSIDTTQPAVAADSAGNFVVVWSASDSDIWGRRFDAAGEPLTPEFLVNSYTSGSQTSPSLAMSADGDFLVVWSGDTAVSGIFGQRFDAGAAPVGQEFRVDSGVFSAFEPRVARASDSGLLVVWAADGHDGSDFGVVGRYLDASATPMGREFQVNSTTFLMQWRPAVAASSQGGFVATWQDLGHAGSGYRIVGRRLAEAVFHGDFESGDACNWSETSGGGPCT